MNGKILIAWKSKGPVFVSAFKVLSCCIEQEEEEKELNYFVAALPDRFWQEIDDQEILEAWLDGALGTTL